MDHNVPFHDLLWRNFFKTTFTLVCIPLEDILSFLYQKSQTTCIFTLRKRSEVPTSECVVLPDSEPQPDFVGCPTRLPLQLHPRIETLPVIDFKEHEFAVSRTEYPQWLARILEKRHLEKLPPYQDLNLNLNSKLKDHDFTRQLKAFFNYQHKVKDIEWTPVQYAQKCDENCNKPAHLEPLSWPSWYLHLNELLVQFFQHHLLPGCLVELHMPTFALDSPLFKASGKPELYFSDLAKFLETELSDISSKTTETESDDLLLGVPSVRTLLRKSVDMAIFRLHVKWGWPLLSTGDARLFWDLVPCFVPIGSLSTQAHQLGRTPFSKKSEIHATYDSEIGRIPTSGRFN